MQIYDIEDMENTLMSSVSKSFQAFTVVLLCPCLNFLPMSKRLST